MPGTGFQLSTYCIICRREDAVSETVLYENQISLKQNQQNRINRKVNDTEYRKKIFVSGHISVFSFKYYAINVILMRIKCKYDCYNKHII